MSYRFLFIIAFLLTTIQGLAVETSINDVSRTPISSEGEVTTLQGDVNGDGVVTIMDVTCLINLLLNSDGDDYPANADVNGNGIVNIMDVTSLIDLLLGMPITQIYSTILVTTTDGITIEYLLDENSRLMIAKPNLVIETDGMVMTYELEHMAQLSYGQRTVNTNLSMLKDFDIPTGGTLFMHDLKENALTEVTNADGGVVMNQQGNTDVKVSLSNQPAGEYMIKAASQTIKIVKQ